MKRSHNFTKGEILIDGPVSREKFDEVGSQNAADLAKNIPPQKSVEIETRIREYEFRIDSLKRCFYADDADWKRDAEELLKMLVEDRLQVLKNKKSR